MRTRTGTVAEARAILSLLVLTVGAAGALELSLGVSRDALYRADDTLIRPAVVMLGTGSGIGSIGVLRSRIGYLTYWDNATTHAFISDERVVLNGVRAQVIPALKVRTPVDSTYLYCGLGLAGRASMQSRNYRDSEQQYRRQRDLGAVAFDQSFVLGIALQLSRRVGLDIEAERPGFHAAFVSFRTYFWYDDYPQPVEEESEEDATAGWSRSSAIGIGAGVRLRL